MNEQITIRWLRAHKCCYSLKQLKEVFGNRQSFSLLEILVKLDIPNNDANWVAGEILGFCIFKFICNNTKAHPNLNFSDAVRQNFIIYELMGRPHLIDIMWRKR